MSGKAFLGAGLPRVDAAELTGTLIVVEGTDGVGRSTQIEELKKWLEVEGHAVVTTGWARSPLMQEAIENAKAGHSLNVHTLSLLYLADFADRLENQVVPALRAGFVVLADRYFYTALARAIVRGADRDWIRGAYGFALVPDAVFYMRIGIEDLIPRAISAQTLTDRYWAGGGGEGMDYWEAGMDLRLGEDVYDSWVEYQRRVLAEFEALAAEFSFRVVDAAKSFKATSAALKAGIRQILDAPRDG